jgi:hypothetical protein
MLRVLARCDPLDILYSELIHRLEELGPPVLEPALAALSIAANDDAREGIESVLAGLRVRDDRILRVLLARLAANVELGAILLGQYGDPAALPQLSAALDGCEPDPDGGILGCSDVVELEASISDLGGTLTPAQALKVQAVDALRDAVRRSLLEMQPDDSPPRRGQNPDRARKKARRMMRKKAQRRNRR